jgi:hypothetical protein
MDRPYLIDFPKIEDPRGNLTFLQNIDQVPFDIQRVFWTYDVPGGYQRGGHAYKSQMEIIIAISGSFDVIIADENNQKEKFHLERSYKGLLIPPMYWRHMENFSTNSVSVHLSSHAFDRRDYIWDKNEYFIK